MHRTLRTLLALSALVSLSGCVSRQVDLLLADIGEQDVQAPLESKPPLAIPPGCDITWPRVVRSATFVGADHVLASGPDAAGVERVAVGRIVGDRIEALAWLEDLAGLNADFMAITASLYVHTRFEGGVAHVIWFDLSDPTRPVALRSASVGGVRHDGFTRRHPVAVGETVALCSGGQLWSSDGRSERLSASPLCERDGVTYGPGGYVAWAHQRGAAAPSFQVAEVNRRGLEARADVDYDPDDAARLGDVVRGHMGTHRAVIEVVSRRRLWVLTVGADRAAGAPEVVNPQLTLGDDVVLGVGSRALWLAGATSAYGVDLRDPTRPTRLFSVALGDGPQAPVLLDSTDDRVALRGHDGAIRVVARAGGQPLVVHPTTCR